MTRTLWRLIALLHRIEETALVLALLIMLILAVIQILLRNLMDTGIYWAEPFLRTLVLWVALLGAMIATREQGHISIDTLARYLPEFFRKLTGTVTVTISALLCAVIAWHSFEFVRLEYLDQTIAFAAVPNWLTEVILPLAFLVMAIRFLLRGIGLWLESDR